ncbi:MAG TPA: 4-(cytidine 5'-diphospho)-2-C-methyl-D-erythritol kinase [Fulvivirga sp.]|nr:4-(cytidine 5'-diphospho)-2-C-methyl-D-erythritol kinase [Fulvivirga sp.]
MVVFPNAKINLGLNIISKREDGYHNISSCFYPINFCDVLEILPAKNLSFKSTGIPIPGDMEGNLCLKAFQLLRNDFDIAPVQMHLHKNIPIGAGLGGGSSDASYTIKALNQLFDLKLTDLEMESYASKLGSDCPFFIRNVPVIAEGTGNLFKPVTIDLTGKYLMLVYPAIHIGTKEAYAGVVPKQQKQSISKVINSGIENWQTNLINDFETSIFPKYKVIKEQKDQLYDMGAEYASMTGSGSAVYGIFSDKIKPIKGTVWLEKL